jgi:hypothetical protein
MITFSFEDLAKDSRQLVSPWEIYLRVVASFGIIVSGTLVYSEQQFCVVESANESQIWSRAAAGDPVDFIHTSMESEGRELVWIRRESDGWRAGSAIQKVESAETFSFGEIVAALDDYCERLRKSVKDAFDTDIARLFEWRATQSRAWQQPH